MNYFPGGIATRGARCLLACVALLLPGIALRAQDSTQRSNPSAQNAAPEERPADAPVQQPISAGQVAVGDRLNLNTRFNIYVRGLINPISLVGPAVGAGIGQGRNSPEEWGQGAAGFGRRFASGYARSVISSTISFGVAAIDHEDPRFMSSHEHGIWRRASRAVAGTVIARSDRGTLMPAYSHFAGAYGAAFISNAWYPRDQSSTKDAIERGSTALLSSVVWRLLQEFGPDIRRIFPHH